MRVLILAAVMAVFSFQAHAELPPTWSKGDRGNVGLVCKDAETVERFLGHADNERSFKARVEIELAAGNCAAGMFQVTLVRFVRHFQGFAGPGEMWAVGNEENPAFTVLIPKKGQGV
ncbi:MAG: hypothetical protein VX464_11605 [Pseudomonadota bacterium]|nr:hypothetical protein [Pseudomonadota bacterium]